MKSFIKKPATLLKAGTILLLLSASLNVNGQSEKQHTIKAAGSHLAFLKLEVKGMHCQAGCANSIDSALKRHRGIISSQTIFATHRSFVRYDPALISRDAIIRIIDDKGFRAKAMNDPQ